MGSELLTLLGGGVTGFIFRYLAESRQEKQEVFNRLLTLHKVQEDSYNKAVARVPVDAGKVVRRLIVLVILFAALCAPFILPFYGVSTIVEVESTTPSFLGLIGGATNKYFVELQGYLYSAELRQILVSIVGFYFGSSTASNKN